MRKPILTSQFTLPRYSATIRSLRPWESCFDHLTPVILFHLNLHPPPVNTHLQHKHKSPRLTGHCWQTKVISFKFPAHHHWWEPEFHGSLGKLWQRKSYWWRVFVEPVLCPCCLWGVKNNGRIFFKIERNLQQRWWFTSSPYCREKHTVDDPQRQLASFLHKHVYSSNRDLWDFA